MDGEAYLRAHFARKIKGLREKAGLSQGELGDILGCSRGSISFYEQMQRVPDIEILKNICQYFSVSADYLLGLSDIKSVDPELQAACKYTGLSEKAVKALCTITKDALLLGVLEKFIVSCVPEQGVVSR